MSNLIFFKSIFRRLNYDLPKVRAPIFLVPNKNAKLKLQIFTRRYKASTALSSPSHRPTLSSYNISVLIKAIVMFGFFTVYLLVKTSLKRAENNNCCIRFKHSPQVYALYW